ncbi:hypothetical protein TEU_11525 [Thermococcus eurythermalis]|uniref:Uncharacterized protein n=1 Tax=Thermococcus eurythermalis TaxID=1505907 RepID=A0A097QWN5_9EURY|nr:hypothetical protein [Thermococcus eurythermalis]AIU70904.1 hypothetical protein TEU_11525 [Thermococcus eurythermalis]
MGEITLRVRVPDGMEKLFEREVMAIIKTLKGRREKPRVTLDDVFGIVKSEKSAKELRLEAYEELFG